MSLFKQKVLNMCSSQVSLRRIPTLRKWFLPGRQLKRRHNIYDKLCHLNFKVLIIIISMFYVKQTLWWLRWTHINKMTTFIDYRFLFYHTNIFNKMFSYQMLLMHFSTYTNRFGKRMANGGDSWPLLPPSGEHWKVFAKSMLFDVLIPDQPV